MKKNIGIWGPRKAGKTTYLSVLYHDCLANEWKMKAADEESDEFRLKNYKRLFEEGEYPLATPLQDVGVYTYDISRIGSFGVAQSYRLVLADASGEWFENPIQVRNRFPEVVNPYERLVECHGLVLLLDPEDVQAQKTTHFVTISRALGALERAASNNSVNKPIVPWMAVCFTKMDQEKYRFNINLEGQEMKVFARQVLGEHIYQDILNACDPDRVRFFGCSSIGLEQNGGNRSEIATEESGGKRIDPSRIKPTHIFKPIEWLLR